MKTCRKCKLELDELNFYTDRKTGKLSARCKQCKREYIRINLKKISPERRNEYQKKYKEKYREKRNAIDATRWHLGFAPKGFNFHHWSYNKAHYTDVIILSKERHRFVHNHIIYDKNSMMYKTKSGILLTTKEQHQCFIDSLIDSDIKKLG